MCYKTVADKVLVHVTRIITASLSINTSAFGNCGCNTHEFIIPVYTYFLMNLALLETAGRREIYSEDNVSVI